MFPRVAATACVITQPLMVAEGPSPTGSATDSATSPPPTPPRQHTITGT